MGRPPYNWDDLVEEVWHHYEQYGLVNGMGWTKGIDGKLSFAKEATDAIAVYFQELHDNIDMDMVPKQYGKFQVVPTVIGEVKLESGDSNG